MELDESTTSKVTDCSGLVTKADFVKLCQDLKLLDFGGAMGEKRKQLTPRKEKRREGGEEKGGRNMPRSFFLLCCCQSHDMAVSRQEEGNVDRVLVAFNIWDTDGDGFLTWEDFQQVSVPYILF